jgi:excisionase family DNA binding protein
MSSRLVEVPCVFIGRGDAPWLAETLTDLLRRGYFSHLPALGERARRVADLLSVAATSGQSSIAIEDSVDDGLMSYEAAARWLNVSPRTVRRRVADGVIPAVRLGALVRIRRSDLREVGK